MSIMTLQSMGLPWLLAWRNSSSFELQVASGCSVNGSVVGSAPPPAV